MDMGWGGRISATLSVRIFLSFRFVMVSPLAANRQPRMRYIVFTLCVRFSTPVDTRGTWSKKHAVSYVSFPKMSWASCQRSRMVTDLFNLVRRRHNKMRRVYVWVYFHRRGQTSRLVGVTSKQETALRGNPRAPVWTL